MRKYLILTSIFLFGELMAQPGYRGQRNLLTLGVRSGWGSYLKQGASNIIPSIELEKVINRKKSINFYVMATANRVLIPEYWGFFAGPETGDYYSYSEGSYWVKPLNKLYYSMKGIGFEIKRYVMNSGGLAPYGTYYSYGINTQYWTLRNAVNVRLGESTFDGSQPEFYYYTQTSKLPELQSINVTFSYGKKRFVTDNIFIDYSLTFGMTGFWTNIPNWGNYSYSSAKIESLDERSINNFLVLMNRTQRLQFNLKGGWLF